MNERLQKHLSTLEQLIGLQKESVCRGDPAVQYMHGMLNGLICAHAIFSDSSPVYHSRPFRKRHTRVRHKVKQGS